MPGVALVHILERRALLEREVADELLLFAVGGDDALPERKLHLDEGPLFRDLHFGRGRGLLFLRRGFGLLRHRHLCHSFGFRRAVDGFIPAGIGNSEIPGREVRRPRPVRRRAG